jgi:predicted Rossmann-fold nucleotide-binding protein
VFELKENGWFEMIDDPIHRYEKEVVEQDDDWLLFEVDTKEEKVKPISNIKEKRDGQF